MPILHGLLMAGVALLSVPAWAQPTCWMANAKTGTLTFEGVMEGRAFTGQFEAFEVRVCLSDDGLTDARIEVEVDTGSANTQSRDRDQTLKGSDFFWVAQFPLAVWVSQGIEPQAGDLTHRAAGTLTLRDVSQSQAVEMSLVESGDAYRLYGQANILRLDFNVGVGEFADTDFIANPVQLSFDLPLMPEPSDE